MKCSSILLITFGAVFLLVITIVLVLLLTISVPMNNVVIYAKDGAMSIAPNFNHRPKIIMTYWKPPPPHVLEMLEKHAPEFDLDFYDDKRAGEFLEKHFVKAVRDKFDALLSTRQGPHASDLFRFCALATLPGRNLYLDVKTVLTAPVTNWFPLEGNSVVAVRARGRAEVHIGIIGGAKSWPGWNTMVHRIMKTPNWVSRICYHTHCYQFLHHVADSQITWLESKCDLVKFCRRTKGRDLYGNCCVIEMPGSSNNGSPRIVMNMRDPQYPY